MSVGNASHVENVRTVPKVACLWILVNFKGKKKHLCIVNKNTYMWYQCLHQDAVKINLGVNEQEADLCR